MHIHIHYTDNISINFFWGGEPQGAPPSVWNPGSVSVSWHKESTTMNVSTIYPQGNSRLSNTGRLRPHTHSWVRTERGSPTYNVIWTNTYKSPQGPSLWPSLHQKTQACSRRASPFVMAVVPLAGGPFPLAFLCLSIFSLKSCKGPICSIMIAERKQ